MLQDLSLREGSIEFPAKVVSGRIRVPIRVLEETPWKTWRDGEDTAMMRSEGRRGRSTTSPEFENKTKGEGMGGDGGVKLFRSSWKNRDGGGISVSTSSIAGAN